MSRQVFHFKCYTVSLFILCLIIFSACDNPENDLAQSDTETQVEFTNLEQFNVILYSDSSRYNIFVEIAANSKKNVSVAPNNSVVAYYPTYYIDVPDIPDTSIPYNGQGIITVIEANKINKIFIPQLENIAINTAYLKIINNSIYSLSLQQGSNEKSPLGNRPSIIAPEQNAAYEINPGTSSSYTVMRNTTTPIDFPASFAEFEKGKVYIFTYNGTNLVLTTTWPIPSPIWPSAPENLQAELMTASSSFASVRLSWDAVYGAESYNVYRAWRVSDSFPYSHIATTNTPFYTATGLFLYDLYHFKVSAIKDSKEGEHSKVVPVRVAYPGGMIMFSGGDTFVLFIWSNISGASSYNIYRSETEDGNYLKVDTVIPASGANSFSWGGTGLEPRTTYYFRLSTVIDGTESLQIPAIRTNTVQPLDFRVTETTATSISLAWNTTNVDWKSFSIYRSTSENSTFTRIINNLTADSYTNTGISPNSTYYYYIGITFNAGSSGTFTKLLADRKVSATTEEE